MISATAKRARSSHPSGMTLMEVIVAVAVVGLVAVGMTAAVGGVFGARLLASANQISGVVRYGYNLATLRGKVHRLMFDMEAGSYQLEEVTIAKECLLEEEKSKSGGKSTEREEALAAVTGTQVKDRNVRKGVLPKGIRFAGLQARRHREAVAEGSEPLYFFPDGTAERAFVWLTDGDEVFTVEVTALQGRGIVHDRELESRELRDR